MKDVASHATKRYCLSFFASESSTAGVVIVLMGYIVFHGASGIARFVLVCMLSTTDLYCGVARLCSKPEDIGLMHLLMHFESHHVTLVGHNTFPCLIFSEWFLKKHPAGRQSPNVCPVSSIALFAQ